MKAFYQLTLVDQSQQKRVFPLHDDRVVLGREPVNEIVLADHRISRRHACLWRNGEGFALEDMGSTNGTFVNGHRLTNGQRMLVHGDEIALGQAVRLLYEYMSEPTQPDHVENDQLGNNNLTPISQPVVDAGYINTMRLPHHVFLSYSRRDSDVMRLIEESLSMARLTVWTDEGIEPGTEEWERAIKETMRSCGCFVVILSPDAEKSIWVNREIAYADMIGLRIFPILARGTEEDAIPIRLITHNFTDIRDTYDLPMGRLIDTIRRHLRIQPR